MQLYKDGILPAEEFLFRRWDGHEIILPTQCDGDSHAA